MIFKKIYTKIIKFKKILIMIQIDQINKNYRNKKKITVKNPKKKIIMHKIKI